MPPLVRVAEDREVACHVVQQIVEQGGNPRDIAVTDQLANELMRK
jgi:hypothetical protein